MSNKFYMILNITADQKGHVNIIISFNNINCLTKKVSIFSIQF